MVVNHYGVLTVLILALAGCETLPPAEPRPEQQSVQIECPVAETIMECPVCEATQCPDQTAAVTPPQACPEPTVNECANLAESGALPVIGEKEWAFIEPGDLVLEARIDTGAETSSIHAENIKLVEKDGKRWVHFTMLNPDKDQEVRVERRLHRRILVKQTTGDDYERRYVVRMWVSLGDTRTWLDVSLSDRDDFEFPVLIGRNMLTDIFAVDVSKHHTLAKPSAASLATP